MARSVRPGERWQKVSPLFSQEIPFVCAEGRTRNASRVLVFVRACPPLLSPSPPIRAGERPVIQGLLWLSRPSYWTLDGINVTWDDASGSAGEHMVKMTNGVGWTIRNGEFWGARSFAAVYIASTLDGEPSNWRVAFNSIHDTHPSNEVNQDHLIYCNSGVSGKGGVIERNLLWNAPNGEGVKLGGSSATSGGAANVTVKFNTIWNTRMAIICYGLSADNLIERNLLGKTHPNYGCIRGLQLTGTGNVARDNLGSDSKSMIDNYKGGAGVADGGGNQFPVDPRFDDIGSGGFRPRNPAARGHGRYVDSPRPGIR